eukprot:m.492525 g.492525  ORF g.492525 m.492525 type:complete len:88 (+) comp57277_c0_seq24:140-403(+)
MQYVEMELFVAPVAVNATALLVQAAAVISNITSQTIQAGALVSAENVYDSKTMLLRADIPLLSVSVLQAAVEVRLLSRLLFFHRCCH